MTDDRRCTSRPPYERVSRMWGRFRTAQHTTQGYEFFKTTARFICYARRCCSLSYSSFLTRTSRRCGCIYALCLLIRFRARFLALSSCSHHHFVVATMRPLAPQGILIAFLSGTDVCAQATTCEKLHSWSMTPHPANWEHTHCKISSLALRRSATTLLPTKSVWTNAGHIQATETKLRYTDPWAPPWSLMWWWTSVSLS